MAYRVEGGQVRYEEVVNGGGKLLEAKGYKTEKIYLNSKFEEDVMSKEIEILRRENMA